MNVDTLINEIMTSGMVISIMMNCMVLLAVITAGWLSYHKKQVAFDKRYVIFGRINHTLLAAVIIWIMVSSGYDRQEEFLCLTSLVIAAYLLLLTALSIHYIKKMFLQKHC